MEISEICRGNKILISLPDSEIRIPNLEVEVQGISIFGEIECLHTPQKEGYAIDVRHCSGVKITEQKIVDLGLSKYKDGSFRIRKYTRLLFKNNRWQIIINNGRIKDVEYIHEIQNLITFLK